MSTQNRTIFVAFVAVIVFGFMGCSTSEPVSLKGAGATAPYILYAKWVEAYRAAEPRLNLHYEPKGSGAGIEALKARTIDFAASDIPLTEEEIASMVVKPLHFPTAIEAIVPIYNIPNAPIMNFTGEVLAGIFSGRIRNWNDRSIAALNPKASLPANVIEVVHRSDGSGSTYALTDYLSEVSESWKKEIGRGATVKWPTGNGASGNAALAEKVKTTPYAIGYVELNYAIQEKLSYGYVRNAAGKFEKPDFRAMGAAADAVQNMKSDFRASLVNSPAAGAYPICTLTWLIVPSQISDAGKLREMKRVLRWAYSDGQQIALKMDYGVLQPPLLDAVREQIEKIR